MKVAPLQLTKKLPFEFNKPNDIPPENPKVSPFFIQLVVAPRGFGKTWGILQMLDHISKYNFYNRWIIISPSYETDIKQKEIYERIESKGNFVERYNEATIELLIKIQQETKEYQKLWYEYHKKKVIWDKLKKRGEKSLTDDELETLFSDFLLDDDLSDLTFDEIFEDYPEWLRRDRPPVTHIFIDDCYSERVMSMTRNNPLVKLVSNSRHQFTSLTMAVQSLSGLPRSIRSQTNLWSIYPLRSNKDIDILLLEIETAFPSHQHFYKLMNMAREKEYGFIYVDASSLKEPVVRLGYDEKVEFS
jgi:hypothetical protein